MVIGFAHGKRSQDPDDKSSFYLTHVIRRFDLAPADRAKNSGSGIEN